MQAAVLHTLDLFGTFEGTSFMVGPTRELVLVYCEEERNRGNGH